MSDGARTEPRYCLTRNRCTADDSRRERQQSQSAAERVKPEYLLQVQRHEEEGGDGGARRERQDDRSRTQARRAKDPQPHKRSGASPLECQESSYETETAHEKRPCQPRAPSVTLRLNDREDKHAKPCSNKRRAGSVKGTLRVRRARLR